MGCGTSNQIHAIIVPRVLEIDQYSILNGENSVEESLIQKSNNNEIIENKKRKKMKQRRNNLGFLFGQTDSQKKIVCFQTNQLNFVTISSKIKIPQPILKFDPIELQYEEQQQAFSIDIFRSNSHPPYSHMLALIINSKQIFLCGGISYDDNCISAETYVFQPPDLLHSKINRLGHALMTTRFQKLSPMLIKRYQHVGVVMEVSQMKYIFAFGGKIQKDEIIAQCQGFNLVERKWKKISPMNIARANAMTFIYRNKIYVFGGITALQKCSKKIEVYSPEQNKWELLNFKLHRGLEGAVVWSASPNEIIVIGGQQQYDLVKSVFKLNLAENTYIQMPDMHHARAFHKIFSIDKNEIIVFGGNYADGLQTYNLKTQSWKNEDKSYVTNISTDDINDFSMAIQTIEVKYEPIIPQVENQLENQKHYFFSNDQQPCLIQLNLTLLKWKSKAVPLNLTLKSYMGTLLIQEGLHFLCGGLYVIRKKSTKSCYYYNSLKNECRQLQKMQQGRFSFGICRIENKIYVMGGKNDQDAILSSCEAFNISQEKWQKLPALKYARCSPIIIPFKKNIYIIGGSSKISKIDQIQVYNSELDIMTCLNTTADIILQAAFFSQKNNEIFLMGGFDALGENHYIIKLQINQSQEDTKLMFNKVHKTHRVEKILKTQDEGILLISKTRVTYWKDQMFIVKKIQNQEELAKIPIEKGCIS